jgi:hypothetical protein
MTGGGALDTRNNALVYSRSFDGMGHWRWVGEIRESVVAFKDAHLKLGEAENERSAAKGWFWVSISNL